MKKLLKKILDVIKIILWMVFNPRFLLCFGLGWLITNGWAYIALGIGMWYEIGWLSALASGYLTFLWFPATPEKLVSISLAVFFLRVFFPSDTKTLGVLKDLLEKVKSKRKNKREKKERDDI